MKKKVLKSELYKIDYVGDVFLGLLLSNKIFRREISNLMQNFQ